MDESVQTCLASTKATLLVADQGIGELQGLFDQFLKTEPISVIPRTHRVNLQVYAEYVIRIREQPGYNLRIPTGAVVQNLRAPLDYMLRALAIMHGADPMMAFTAREKQRSYEQYINQRAAHKLPSDVLQWLESHQQFSNGGKHTVLGELTNNWSDAKHKYPVLMCGVNTSVGIRGSSGGTLRCIDQTKPHPDGTVVYTFDGSVAEYSQFRPVFGFTVGLQGGPTDAVSFFRKVSDEIRTEVVPLFSKYLPS